MAKHNWKITFYLLSAYVLLNVEALFWSSCLGSEFFLFQELLARSIERNVGLVFLANIPDFLCNRNRFVLFVLRLFLVTG